MSRVGVPPNMMRPIGPGPPGPPMMGAPIKPLQSPNFPSLCQDFLKGVCSVFQCPKNHPEASLLFCQAYQRDCCQQGQACTFMHATAEEEQYYKDTGLIPLRFMSKPIRMERGKGPLPNGQPSLFPADSSPAAEPQFPDTPEVPAPVKPQQPVAPTPPEQPAVVLVEPQSKRLKLSYDELEVEMNMLKEKVKILEKKVDQLDAANDVLLDKNAKLRKRSHSRERARRSPRRNRHDRDRSRERNRSRSKERARSKDTQQESRMDSRPAGRWNDFGNNSAGHNNFTNRGPA